MEKLPRPQTSEARLTDEEKRSLRVNAALLLISSPDQKNRQDAKQVIEAELARLRDRVKELEGAIAAAGKNLGVRTICPKCQQAAVEHDLVDLVHLAERKPSPVVTDRREDT